jgi:hypothetical protein
MRRFSVRSLMLLIVGAALGLAALRSANVYWAATTATLFVAALATSVVGALALRGREQYQWAGFAVFSVVYLAATALSLLFEPFYYFGTTVALNYVQSQVVGDSSASLAHLLQRRARVVALIEQAPTMKQQGSQEARELKADLAALDENIRLYALDSNARWRSWLPGAANTYEFRCVGHSLFALLSGLAGTAVGKMFYARRERGQNVRAVMP